MGCAPSLRPERGAVLYRAGSNRSGSTATRGLPGLFRATDPPPEATSEEEFSSRSGRRLGSDAPDQEGSSVVKFGPMCLNRQKIKALLIFPKEDAQSDALKWAAEKLQYECSMVYDPEKALEEYLNRRHHLIFVDSRQSRSYDPVALCGSLRAIRGSQYTCIVAVVKRNTADREDGSIMPLIRAGFNRWLLESCNLGFCLNELIQLEHNEIVMQLKLRAAQALFTALDNCRDGIIITSANHDVQFLNRSSEKLLGFTADEIIGKSTQEIYKSDSTKADVIENINMQIMKGKEWEGKLLHKRKSGENMPLWSRISPVEITTGFLDHIVYVKEYPYIFDKSLASDSEMLPFSCAAVKTLRKASCDVRSLCSEAGMNRRQSFARFHAMTIEAPITKVINMLLATQENSPIFVAQALDRALEILRSTELYSPQFPGLQQVRAEDQITSDLVTGLVTGQKTYRRFSHEVAFKGLSAPPTTMATSAALPNLTTAPIEVRNLLEKEAEWNFDILLLERITEKRPLIWLGMAIFTRFNVYSTLGCDEKVIRNWLSLIEANYHDNPYHNSTHAADVLQATAYFLQKPRLKAIFDPLDEVISLVAAIVHDVDHPGKTSAFLCNSSNNLAILYNDLSVLESHHAAFAFKLTNSGERVNIFQHLDRDNYRAVRQSIIDMVLATEMTKHFEHISKFVNVFAKSVAQDEEPFEQEKLGPESSDLAAMSTPENIILVKRMLIKCADVSNPARPLHLCKEWASRIAEEYCSQTDEEKTLGLPVVMPTFDRNTCSIPKSQIGFMDYFANDMFDAWDAFGDFPELIEHLKFNYQYWKEQEQLRDNKIPMQN
ncbi:LOW QUALITY PROTEIN: high affinity cAMP-specific and IBMX-insensitive 3',5'-cyclic phosphodiesterase 8B-like [Centruroides vittatus]|uniref:LOW QUALITY PROTEIN: high affinity cAMP-specific and IBMX-insensitive 3',5'-cyclic phosphodiesterase 8B-like n=1 Tax=Centruroides vittatus TaxID=120091 RepID=UPI0035102B3B